MKRKFANFLINLPRQVKRLLSLGFDLSVSLFCTFGFLLIVTNDTEQLSNTQNLSIAALLACLQIGALWASGTYQTVARFLGLKSLAKSSLFLLSVNAFIFVSFSIYGVGNIPNSLGVAQPALFFSFFLGSRFLVAILLSNYNAVTTANYSKSHIVLIYGASDSGRQLAMALMQSKETEVIGFLDDDASLKGAIIQSVKVYPTASVEELINSRGVTHVLLALPSISKSQKSQIIQKISVYGVKVLTLPSLSELAEGKLTINDLKEVQIEDPVSYTHLTLPTKRIV